MLTRGRGLGGRGRGRRGRCQIDLHDSQTLDEIHWTEPVPPVVDYEEGFAPPDGGEEPMTPGNEGQLSHAHNKSDKRTRGETQGNHAANDRDSRPFIEPFHDRFIPELTSRRIMDILRRYMGPWPTWEQVPRDRKEFLYEKFREHFRWLSEHEAGIRHSWEQTHKRNFKNTIYRYKKKAMKEAGCGDPMEIQKVVPKNMQSRDWEAICKRHMSASNYQEKCAKARQNRLTKKDGSITKHTGGSISFVQHARRLAQDGRVVSQVEVHDRTHCRGKGEGEYVDNKSKRAREEYERDYISQHGSNSTPDSSFHAHKWIQVSGGFGNIAVDGSNETTSMIPAPNYVTQDQLQEIIAKAIDERLVKKREATTVNEAEERKKSEEKAKAREEAMRAMRTMMTTLGAMMEQLNALTSVVSSYASTGKGDGEGGNNN